MNSAVFARLAPLAVVGCLIVGGSPSASAGILFDFEEQSIGSYSSITSTKGGLTVTVLPPTGASLAIVDLQFGSTAPSFGTRTIANFSPGGNPVTFNFSAPVSNVSLSFGDFDADDDDTVTISAFGGLNGTGASIGSSSTSYPANLDIFHGDADVRTLSVVGGGILSLTFSSGGQFPGSLYLDNLSVNSISAVPEPSTLTLAGVGVLLVALYGRRRRRPAA